VLAETLIDALVWWIGFVPAVRTYPGGKVMSASAVSLYVPAWHRTWVTVTAWALFCAKSLSPSTVTPLRISSSLRLIDVTALLHWTDAPSATWLPAVRTGVGAVITQLMVC
jgi:hypothetical protein